MLVAAASAASTAAAAGRLAGLRRYSSEPLARALVLLRALVWHCDDDERARFEWKMRRRRERETRAKWIQRVEQI